MKSIFQILSLALVFVACEPEEIPIEPISGGANEIGQVNLGEDYGNQLYYSLESNSIIKDNVRTDWEIGFESSSDGWHIRLNSALYAGVKYIDDDFEAIVHPDTFSWSYDVSTGDLDSTAFDDWRSKSGFYVFDMGVTSTGTKRGYRRIKIENVDESGYLVRMASMDMSADTTLYIPKNPSTNFTAVSLVTNKVVDIEPNKAEWDLHFTQYTFIFHNPPTAYSVTGALSNPNGVVVSEVAESWENIDRTFAESLEYSRKVDEIGYDWKEFDFDSGLYEVHSHRIFVIRSIKGVFYKLRFIDFYDGEGRKGFPKFEIARL